MVVAAVALVAALSFVWLRLATHDGDASRFVVAGDHFTDPDAAPAGLAVLVDSTGADGQYYYRLALDPLTTKRTDFGITLVAPAYNQQRIVYPVLAWAASGGGRARALPWVLIGVNVVAMTALAFAGAHLVRSLGHHSAWGLALALQPGAWITLGWDLTELVAGVAVVAALVLLRQGRTYAAAGAMSVAVLTRETTVLLPIAGVLMWLAGRHQTPLRTWAIPLGAFATWQSALIVRWGQLPARGTPDSLGIPGGGFLRSLRFNASDDPLTALELLVFLGFVVAVVRSMRRPGTALRDYERVAAVLFLVLASVAGFHVWFSDLNFLRTNFEFVILGTVALLADPTSRRDLVAWGLGVVSFVAGWFRILGV